MSNDWYVEQGRARMAEISAQRSQAVADLEQARVYDDDASAREAIQRLADLDVAAQSLNSLYNRHIASQTPPPEPSWEEIMARPPDRTTHEDMYKILNRTTKRGVSDNDYAAGMIHVRNNPSRRQR
jgi:hypothetical protein